MKPLVASLLALLALGLTAASASAADLQTCRSERASSDAPGYERVGSEVRESIAPEARKYLGSQYAASWMQPDDAGWYVGVAPGKRSLADVRTWLAGRVTKHFRGKDAALIRSRMHVIAQPYGIKALRKAGTKAWEILGNETQFTFSGDEACTLSDAYRAEITLYKGSTDAQVREVKSLLAELGDRIRVTRVDYSIDDVVG